MKNDKNDQVRLISFGKQRKTAQVVIISTDPNTGKKLSRTRHLKQFINGVYGYFIPNTKGSPIPVPVYF